MLGQRSSYQFRVHLIDGSAVPVQVDAPTFEEAEQRAVDVAGAVVGQDVSHLVSEVEGV